jgi:hypothetical protein
VRSNCESDAFASEGRQEAATYPPHRQQRACRSRPGISGICVDRAGVATVWAWAIGRVVTEFTKHCDRLAGVEVARKLVESLAHGEMFAHPRPQ